PAPGVAAGAQRGGTVGDCRGAVCGRERVLFRGAGTRGGGCGRDRRGCHDGVVLPGGRTPGPPGDGAGAGRAPTHAGGHAGRGDENGARVVVRDRGRGARGGAGGGRVPCRRDDVTSAPRGHRP